MSATVQTADPVARHLETLAAFEKQHVAPQWLQEIRERGKARFTELGFPTTRDEEWKYTDVTPIANLSSAPVFNLHLNGAVNRIEPFIFGDAYRLVFVNGHFSPELSDTNDLPPGVLVGSLAQAIDSDAPGVREHLAQYATRTNDDAFTALNIAFLHDGAFIFVPKNVAFARPIEVLFMASAGENAMVIHPRNLIIACDNSEVTIVETYAGNAHDVYFTNAVTEVVAGENAIVDHYKVQMESDHAFHIGTLQVQAARSSNFRSHAITLGARLTRNNANAIMGGENVEVTLNGLVLGRDQQHIDNHTVMDHAQPHCLSHELYAHVLDGKSVGVFNGKIFVRLDAQKTDAVQSNRSLLLSDDAVINTKPQLEIFADDVKCTHGATVGQLDEAALFYLRARGIHKDDARDLLIYAFAEEVLNGVRVDALRERMEEELLVRLAQSRALHAH